MVKLEQIQIIQLGLWVSNLIIGSFLNEDEVFFISDVVVIEKTGEHFRLIYDVKGRFTIHRITAEEAKVWFCKIFY